MKTSNIFLLFLLASFVIIGNMEVAMATRTVEENGGKKCERGSVDIVNGCVDSDCDNGCRVNYGSTATGACKTKTLCVCYGPC
ncbi:unnamed protein product [Linum tenue]|uniref:Defensin-like protein n=1 Tax=Linum tenue TaxID=586396 RepID=A0AAV0LQA6_9ROSI|nr:unnamed protein product [Linum tenue]